MFAGHAALVPTYFGYFVMIGLCFQRGNRRWSHSIRREAMRRRMIDGGQRRREAGTMQGPPRKDRGQHVCTLDGTSTKSTVRRRTGSLGVSLVRFLGGTREATPTQ